jgi:hypothetical protein
MFAMEIAKMPETLDVNARISALRLRVNRRARWPWRWLYRWRRWSR